jgi:hypothetical protein
VSAAAAASEGPGPDAALCTDCSNHQGAGLDAYRDLAHISLYIEMLGVYRRQLEEQYREQVDLAVWQRRRAEADRDEAQAGLRSAQAEMAARPQPRPVVDRPPVVRTVDLTQAHADPDQAFQVLLQIWVQHHKHTPGFCQCGRHLSACATAGTLAESAAFNAWHEDQIELHLTGRSTRLPPDHPAIADARWLKSWRREQAIDVRARPGADAWLGALLVDHGESGPLQETQ